MILNQNFKSNIYYGQWNPPQDEVLYMNYFTNVTGKQNISIECGASNAGTGTHLFSETLGWTCYNLEASRYAFIQLEDYRKDAINLNFGLSNVSETKIFRDIISAPGGGNDNGSFLHTNTHMQELKGYNCVFEEYPVTTMTYTKFVNFPVQLFVLDVEGYELQVIEGMLLSKFLPNVICVEYPITGLNKIKNILSSIGYNFNFVSFNNAYFSFIQRDSWFGETEKMQDYDD